MEKKQTKLFKDNKETQKRNMEEEEEEDLETISLSDLQMNEGNESPKNSFTPPEFFEFFTESSDSENYTFSDLFFCGKIINKDSDVDEREEADELNENLSPLFRSNSFHRSITGPLNKNRANYASQNLQRVNTITGLTSMSAKCRRRMFMFGPVKFKPEMELSAIKQGQGHRRAPATRFPVGGKLATPVIPASDNGEKTALVKSSQKKKKNNGAPTGKLMELWHRPHFLNVLAKSLSCFSMTKHCIAVA